jgi:hypothetical protein
MLRNGGAVILNRTCPQRQPPSSVASVCMLRPLFIDACEYGHMISATETISIAAGIKINCASTVPANHEA